MDAVSGLVTVMCDSNNPLESPEICTLESLEEGTFNFSCNTIQCTWSKFIGCLCLSVFFPPFCAGNAASFMISIGEYPPGEYNLTIDAVDIFDQIASEVLTIFLPGKTTCLFLVVS